MELIEVKSSNIARVGYDSDSRTLGVQFTGGNVYHYFDVPADIHQQMMANESKGKFFAAQIKPKFKCQKVDSQTAPAQPKTQAQPTSTPTPPVLQPGAAVIEMPASALALSFEAGTDTVGFPALPFDQMVRNVKQRTDDYCAPVLAQIRQLATEALAITVTDAASYATASALGTALKNQRLAITDTLKSPKQSIDKVKQVFLSKEHEMQDVIEQGETHLANTCTAWRMAEKQRAEAIAKAEQESKKTQAEERRLTDAQKAIDAGRPALADKLLSTPVPIPKVEVKTEVPKTSAKGKTLYKYRVIDQSKIPDIWWVLDEKAIAAHARAKKYDHGTVIDGIEFYQEEDTNF